MRGFERLVYKLDTFMELNSVIGMDQFAYKENCNTTMAFIKCQHNWSGWLDDDVHFVRVLSINLSKAFDTVSRKIVCEKSEVLIISIHIYKIPEPLRALSLVGRCVYIRVCKHGCDVLDSRVF